MASLEPVPQKLSGQVALVTGAARGLGRAYALRLVRLGADVVVNDVDLLAWQEYDQALTPGCETVVDEIGSLGRQVLGAVADVTDAAHVRRMVNEAVVKAGRLGEPEDCAKVVEFLVTDLSDYVTGQVIPVCGGVCLF